LLSLPVDCCSFTFFPLFLLLTLDVVAILAAQRQYHHLLCYPATLPLLSPPVDCCYWSGDCYQFECCVKWSRKIHQRSNSGNEQCRDWVHLAKSTKNTGNRADCIKRLVAAQISSSQVLIMTITVHCTIVPTIFICDHQPTCHQPQNGL